MSLSDPMKYIKFLGGSITATETHDIKRLIEN
jgi:hypothetical protein